MLHARKRPLTEAWNPAVCRGAGSVWLDVSLYTCVAAQQRGACRQIQDMTLLVPEVSAAKTEHEPSPLTFSNPLPDMPLSD